MIRFWILLLLLRRRRSDVDECQTDVCAGQCLNTPGSFRCFCDGREGMKLSQDLRSCKVKCVHEDTQSMAFTLLGDFSPWVEMLT